MLALGHPAAEIPGHSQFRMPRNTLLARCQFGVSSLGGDESGSLRLSSLDRVC
jgi:hypothetical protein